MQKTSMNHLKIYLFFKYNIRHYKEKNYSYNDIIVTFFSICGIRSIPIGTIFICAKVEDIICLNILLY